MSSRNRIEPDTRNARAIPDGALVRLADPAWMLSRQWWVGEFKGFNGGAPVSVQLDARRDSLTGGTSGMDAFIPSSVLATTSDDWRGSLALGIKLYNRMTALIARYKASGANGNVVEALEAMQEKLHQNFALTPAVMPPSLRRVDQRKRIDGYAIAASIRANDGRFEGIVMPEIFEWFASLPDVKAAATFHAETGSTSAEIDGGIDVVRVHNASGPALHWDDIQPSQTPEEMADFTAHAVPTRLVYAGDAPNRWWGLEDAGRDWTAAPAGPSDLGQLVIASTFTKAHRVAWIAPFDVPSNSVLYPEKITVTDGFGNTIEVQEAKSSVARAWTDGTENRAMPILATAPLLLGDPTDVVAFGTDEMDNLLWAEVRTEKDDNGRGHLVQAVRKDRTVTQPEYAVRIPPPDNWHPYIQMDDQMERRTFDDDLPQPVLSIMPTRLDLQPMQISRDGWGLQQRWVLGRAADGSRHVWRVNTDAQVKLSGSSGLAHDVLLKPEGAN